MSDGNTTLVIYCAVCERPVERIEREYDLRRRETVFTVFCHGAQQRAYLADAVLREANGISITEAFAFVDEDCRLLPAADADRSWSAGKICRGPAWRPTVLKRGD